VYSKSKTPERSRTTTGGVHRLEDEEHAPAVLRVELVLEIGKVLHARGQNLLRLLLLFLQPSRVAGVPLLQAELLPVGNAVGADELRDVGHFDFSHGLSLGCLV
jgi:hypothetical protein